MAKKIKKYTKYLLPFILIYLIFSGVFVFKYFERDGGLINYLVNKINEQEEVPYDPTSAFPDAKSTTLFK